MFDEGKIGGDVLNLALQNYAWAAGDCESEFQRMTLDDAESFYNMWSQLLLRAMTIISILKGLVEGKVLK